MSRECSGAWSWLKRQGQQPACAQHIETKLLFVSKPILGQPRGIANLGFVADRLSY
jgi:hypothetical protein